MKLLILNMLFCSTMFGQVVTSRENIIGTNSGIPIDSILYPSHSITLVDIDTVYNVGEYPGHLITTSLNDFTIDSNTSYNKYPNYILLKKAIRESYKMFQQWCNDSTKHMFIKETIVCYYKDSIVTETDTLYDIWKGKFIYDTTYKPTPNLQDKWFWWWLLNADTSYIYINKL